MAQNKSEHISELVKELLDDIELNRISVEAILLKTSRLARFVDSYETQRWIYFEMNGYDDLTDPLALKYINITGRIVDKTKGTFYNVPVSQLDATLNAENIKLRETKVPDTSGEWAYRVMHMYAQNLETITKNISHYSGIRSKVIAQLHSFISNIFYEKEFDNLSETIFEKYKSDVDTLISVHCGKVLQQIPSVMARLSENENESISQALVTIRRIIDSFADSIYPPSDKTIEIGGNTISLDASKHQNRINAFVNEKIESSSRKTKIRQNLSNLYIRVSSGVHNDVTAEEAKSLFLNTYLLLGEILHISKIGK